MRLFTSCFLFLALLASCGAPADPPAEDTTETTTDLSEVPDANPTATLDATVAAVQSAGGDLTALPADAAVANIDTWTEQLAGVDGADKVTANLDLLKEELTSGDINGPLAGMLLVTLAEDTRKVVGDAGNAATGALVSALNAAGDKLTQSATSGESLLSQTLGAVKQFKGDITTLPAEAAVGNIDSWIAKLSSLDGADGMVEELKMLKTELGQPNIDGEKVASYLESMADSTEEMAADNPSLQVLAYALKAGSRRLKGE